MIITFCGHSQYTESGEDEQKILSMLTEIIGDRHAEIYLGGYGSFDTFALKCGKKYQKTHPNTKLILVTPYMTVDYQKNHLEYQKDIYDEIIYPELEKVPLKFAISYRNKWMVEQADYVIAYIDHSWGGAYQTYKHAKRKKKLLLNMFESEFEGETNMVPIEVTAESMEHLGSNQYYIRHIFNALSEHKELLEQPDYKRLYDEAQDFLFRCAVRNSGWKKHEREIGYKRLEFLAYLNNTYDPPTEKYPIETVDSFLAERRKVWNL